MTSDFVLLEEKFGARNYAPMPVVIVKAKGCWVKDTGNKKYFDCLSAYSALNQGHRHPKIINAAKKQLGRLTLTSRAFYNDMLGKFLEELVNVSGLEKALPMNSGAEAVETALKAARKWAYTVKGIEENKANIIVCKNNFHGRTTTIVGFSSEEQYKKGFGPYCNGFKLIEFNDANALLEAIDNNTAAFLVEPIQGEGGIIFPSKGYLKEVRKICTEKNVLMVLDEIQTGFGRTGKMFAFQHDNIKPDILIVGKALGGGIMPVSAMISSKEIMDVFNPGDHGSTFGGNPLACAVGIAAINVIKEESLCEKSRVNGEYFLEELKKINSPFIKEIRGQSLFIGIEIKKEFSTAKPFCLKLLSKGLLCKETHEQVIRLAPPLVATKKELAWAAQKIKKVFESDINLIKGETHERL
jgi:ornithine--oxo-acid transaminase